MINSRRFHTLFTILIQLLRQNYGQLIQLFLIISNIKMRIRVLLEILFSYSSLFPGISK